MTVKFFLSTALAILAMATDGYSLKEPVSADHVKVDKKEKQALEKAGDAAAEEGYELYYAKNIDHAKAAFKIAAAHYKQAGNIQEAKRMKLLSKNPDAYNGSFESSAYAEEETEEAS